MERELGDVGTQLLWEDEHVKTWDLVLEPGQSSDWHRHSMPYVFTVTRAGRLRTEYEDGSVSAIYNRNEYCNAHAPVNFPRVRGHISPNS